MPTVLQALQSPGALLPGNLEILARQVVEGFITGMHKSPFHGFSVEFAEHRPYNTGENVKNIDWKLYARTDKLFVKRFEDETNLRVHVVLDASSSMYYPQNSVVQKIHFSVVATAALVHLFKKQRDAFGLTVFSGSITDTLPARSTMAHQQLVFGMLQQLLLQKETPQTTSLSATLHHLAENTHRRSMMIIFSDMMERNDSPEALFAALQHLKHCKHEVVVINPHHQNTEYALSFDNRPHKFVDVETGETIALQPEEVKVAYAQAVDSYYTTLRNKCAQYRIDWVDANITDDFSQILSAYLVKRNKMAR